MVGIVLYLVIVLVKEADMLDIAEMEIARNSVDAVIGNLQGLSFPYRLEVQL